MDLPNKSGATPQPPKKEIKALVSGAAVHQVSRPATRRFRDYVFAENPKDIFVGVVKNLIGPRIKGVAEEAMHAVIHGMFTGNPPTPGGIVAGTVLRSGSVNYNSISAQPSSLTQARQAIQNVSSSAGNYQDLLFNQLHDAEVILARLYDLHNQYRIVTVADLYELVEKTPSISDNGYGWTTLETAKITPRNGGYVLELPKPVLI